VLLSIVILYFLIGTVVFLLPAGVWEKAMEGIQYTDYAADRAWTPQHVAEALSDIHQLPTVVLMWPVLLFVVWRVSHLRQDAEWLKAHLDEVEEDSKAVGAVFCFDPQHDKCTMCRIDARACAKIAFPTQDARGAATVVSFVDGEPQLETRRIVEGFGGRFSLREPLEETDYDQVRKVLLKATMFKYLPEDDER
jgi:hypothetical protein